MAAVDFYWALGVGILRHHVLYSEVNLASTSFIASDEMHLLRIITSLCNCLVDKHIEIAVTYPQPSHVNPLLNERKEGRLTFKTTNDFLKPSVWKGIGEENSNYIVGRRAAQGRMLPLLTMTLILQLITGSPTPSALFDYSFGYTSTYEDYYDMLNVTIDYSPFDEGILNTGLRINPLPSQFSIFFFYMFFTWMIIYQCFI
ncbi:hypothetical protein NDU88_001083 [Pleurodeles waltl]|uniref:Uncharacterized protein n=1 Tax=Pleurodeles waltl TaxID=8319 RepID=A0AAV7KRP2_PLEWA|nr:hypothetical protein NDU88_001083 [Pleurodeles waltl]